MALANTQELKAALRTPEAGALGICAAVGIGAAVIGWYSGAALGAIVVLPVMALVAWLTFGATGSLLAFCMVSSVYLMVRIDEAVVIPFGNVSLKASYWLVMASALALMVLVFFRALSGQRALRNARQFNGRFMAFFFGFAATLLLSSVMNQLLEPETFGRDVRGEFLASISILAPMLFVPLVLLAPMKRSQVVLTAQVLIALGGAAGLTMAAFGFLPSKLLDVLGWTAANQGTAGLLRGRLPLGHPNNVAAFLIMLLPLTAILGLIPGGRHYRGAYLLCAVLMFGGILFTLARSALIIVALIVVLTVSYIYFGKGRKTLMTYLLPAIFAVGLVGVMTYLFLTFDFSRFWSRGYYEDASVERRNNSIATALYIFKDYPIWGITPDAMYTRLEIRPGWEPPMSDRISPIYYYQEHMSAETPHNMYLTVLAESGILGAFFFFGMLLSILLCLWRLRKAPHLSDEQRHTLMGFILGITGFLLMGAFESLLMVGMRPAFLFWAFAALGIRYAHEITAAAPTEAEA